MHVLLTQGGPVMWPLLACSIVSVAVILERAIFWVRATCQHDKKSLNRVFDLTEIGEFEKAVDVGARSSSVAVRVLCAGLIHREYGLVQSMEAAASAEIERMKRGLSTLDTIITLAPLLGILGTVVGIIASFDLLGQAGIEDPKAVTGGIAQALVTTAAGLSVAIVTLLPYNALARKLEKATKFLELIATHFEVTYQKGVAKRHEAE